MNLYFLRHGLAVDRGTPGHVNDAARPLTPKGRQRLWQVAEAMEAMELEFDVIFTSPHLRALQTADIIAGALELRKKLVLVNDLIPAGSPKTLLEKILRRRPKPENILLVGHEPYLSKLIALFVTGNTAAAIELKKGGLAKLEIETLRYGRCATLVWLLTPKQMTLMV